MLRFAVCDDEPFMLDQLAGRLEHYMERGKIPCRILRFSSGKALLDSSAETACSGKSCGRPGSTDTEKQAFDLIMLDIEMDPPDGMETARLLRERGWEGLLIFITVLKERVFDAFEAQPFDYLVKPLDETRFARTMDRALKILQQNSGQSLLVQKGASRRIIPFSQILYCEVLGRKIYIHQKNGQVLDYYEKLESLQHRVDGRFFRCHRSFLVNLDFVRGCEGGIITLEAGGQIPLSRLREQEFTEALLSHMKERRC